MKDINSYQKQIEEIELLLIDLQKRRERIETLKDSSCFVESGENEN